jgi:hydrogenase nickel incorporation protein HypA/HybF
MHELALSHNMVEIIKREAILQAFQRVETVRMEIGMLSCVEPDALRFCFDTATKGTVAEGARLEIITVAAQVLCEDCGARGEIDRWGVACHACGSHRLEIRGGDQMRIKDLEVH